jgi:hypothetical protein
MYKRDLKGRTHLTALASGFLGDDGLVGATSKRIALRRQGSNWRISPAFTAALIGYAVVNRSPLCVYDKDGRRFPVEDNAEARVDVVVKDKVFLHQPAKLRVPD